MQIGPRIRVGGTAGRIGQNTKNAIVKGATDVGHAAGNALDNKYVQAATAAALAASGVGAPAAAAMLAAQAAGGKILKPGGNIGDAASAGLKAGVTSYGTGKLLGSAGKVLGDKVPLGIGDRVASMGRSIGDKLGSIPGASTLGRIGQNMIGTGRDIAAGMVPEGDGPPVEVGSPGGPMHRMPPNAPTAGRTDVATRTAGPGGQPSSSQDMSWLDKLLMGTTIGAGTMDALERQKLRSKAQNYAQGSYDARAPLRQRAMKLLGDTSTPDYSSMYSDPGNPYDTARRARELAAAGGV